MNRLQIRGRIDRHTYRLWTLGLGLLVFVSYGLVASAHWLVANELTVSGAWVYAWAVLSLPWVAIGVLISMKRAQDIDLPPILGLAVLIPFVGVAVWFFFYMKHGTIGKNRYGDAVVHRMAAPANKRCRV